MKLLATSAFLRSFDHPRRSSCLSKHVMVLTMQTPMEITFRHCEASEDLRSEIVRQAKRLEKYSSRITSCHVTVVGPGRRHKQGGVFGVELRIALPEHKDIIVTKTHGDVHEREHALVAISEAFGAAQRQIEDAMRGMRGQVKTHSIENHGHISKFLAEEDCGFIETADGREIYFHKNAVLGGNFERLVVGSEVRFVEEQGEKGLQASTVRVVGKHHLDMQ
jgi:cold shock CspA family protein/ribosome-associated translation inhibitor RaiA